MKNKPNISVFNQNKDPSDFLDNSSADQAEASIKKDNKTTVTSGSTIPKLFRISSDLANQLKLYAVQQSVSSGSRVTESNIVEKALSLYLKNNN